MNDFNKSIHHPQGDRGMEDGGLTNLSPNGTALCIMLIPQVLRLPRLQLHIS